MKQCDLTLSGVLTEAPFRSVQKHFEIFFTYLDLLPQLSLYFIFPYTVSQSSLTGVLLLSQWADTDTESKRKEMCGVKRLFAQLPYLRPRAHTCRVFAPAATAQPGSSHPSGEICLTAHLSNGKITLEQTLLGQMHCFQHGRPSPSPPLHRLYFLHRGAFLNDQTPLFCHLPANQITSTCRACSACNLSNWRGSRIAVPEM